MSLLTHMSDKCYLTIRVPDDMGVSQGVLRITRTTAVRGGSGKGSCSGGSSRGSSLVLIISPAILSEIQLKFLGAFTRRAVDLGSDGENKLHFWRGN